MTSDTLLIAYSQRKPSFARSLPREMTCWLRRKPGVHDWIRFFKRRLLMAWVAMVVEEGVFQNPTLNSISLHCLLGTSSWRLSICSFARWSTGSVSYGSGFWPAVRFGSVPDPAKNPTRIALAGLLPGPRFHFTVRATLV
jgi:hypothetical protein